jgi:hypothetical protein
MDFILATGETMEVSDPKPPDPPAWFFRVVWGP